MLASGQQGVFCKVGAYNAILFALDSFQIFLSGLKVLNFV